MHPFLSRSVSQKNGTADIVYRGPCGWPASQRTDITQTNIPLSNTISFH